MAATTKLDAQAAGARRAWAQGSFEPLQGSDNDDGLPNWLAAKMRLLRPVVETGWETVLLMRLCADEALNAAPGVRPLSVGEIVANWGPDLREQLCARYELSPDDAIKLYGGTREQSHPGNVYYVLVCRVALGHYVRTRDAAPRVESVDGAGGGAAAAPCFERENTRELARVPNVNPPIHYHALLGEKGPGHLRHREVVLFHGEYLYPEYLLGVHRVSQKGKTL